MANSILVRRKVLHAPLAYAAAWYLLGNDSDASTLPATPTQTAGPFYPLTYPADSDNDLLHVAGHSGVAHGVPTKISGRVLDLNGRSISGARVEIWQCDANGRYHYVRDNRTDQPRDDDFGRIRVPHHQAGAISGTYATRPLRGLWSRVRAVYHADVCGRRAS